MTRCSKVPVCVACKPLLELLGLARAHALRMLHAERDAAPKACCNQRWSHVAERECSKALPHEPDKARTKLPRLDAPV